MKQNTLKIEITLNNEILGSTPGNKEITEEFIASKAPTVAQTQEEVACVTETLEKGTTVFPKDEKGLFLWDYQFKGFLKHSIGVMAEMGDIALSKWTFKRAVDCSLFVTPRKIYFLRDGKNITEPDGFCERPLRAETMQGDRIALARSQKLNEGITAELEITHLESTNAKSKFACLNMDAVREALNYGYFNGLGQWRNSGRGAFSWKEVK